MALFWVIGVMDWVLFGSLGDSLLWLFLILNLNYALRIRVVMDVASITAALQGLVVAKKLFSGYIDKEGDSPSQMKMNEALRNVSDAQEVVYSLRDELFNLQDENRELNNRLKEARNWERTIESYSLVETSGGAIVYKSDSEPRHFSCPSCVQSKELHILQDKRVASGIFECPKCKSVFPVNVARFR